MQSLNTGSFLQGGKYRIEKALGQGGFGITYSAFQVALNRRVAIKEFFMKEYCERNSDTSHVTLGTAGSAETVKRFKEKFMKEAALIAQFNNSHIVRIYDIFEENGTAYYVMEFLEDRWSQYGKDGIPWEPSLNIIRQIGDGLSYIHAHNVLHLDVKPSNILFREDCAVLIDFGISKRYDAEGSQTSSTPVGISKGYAPLEQYNQGVQKFMPATDVYSLGATLYKLLTGETPPEASDVMNYGLPTECLKAKNIPENVIAVITKCMDPRVGQRYQAISQVLDAIGKSPEPVKEPENFRKQEAASDIAIPEKVIASEDTVIGEEKGSGITDNIKLNEPAYEEAIDTPEPNLAYMYENGYGTNKDYTEDIKLVRKAAEQGDANAQNNLAYMYENGYGVTKDYAEAVKWYRKAAEQGYTDAQNNLAYMYENGYGITQNYTEAVKWYRKAADQGNAYAQYNLGIMYENGNGVSNDSAEAAKWYQMAAYQGDADAKSALERLNGK